MASLAVSFIRQRVVAHVKHTTGPRSDANPMVPADGTHQLDQQVFVVNPLKETAVYVERMPGGVRGGGREAPLYSIMPYQAAPWIGHGRVLSGQSFGSIRLFARIRNGVKPWQWLVPLRA